MNAQLMPRTLSAVAEYSATEAALAELRAQLEGATFDCSNPADDKLARESRRGLVSLRTDLEARRKELKAPLLERGRLIDDEAKRITGEIVALETPIDAAIKAEEARRERIREERQRAEREAAAEVTRKITAIRETALELVSAPASMVEAAIAETSQLELTAEVYGERLEEAKQAQEATLAKLATILKAAQEQERLQAELRAQREQAERERAEQQAQQAEADRIAREAREQADREAAEERERAAEKQRQQQAELDARQAELDREAKRQREAAANEAREQAEREDAERRQREAEAIANATLREAATEAHVLLLELAPGHLVARKLGAALARGTEE